MHKTISALGLIHTIISLIPIIIALISFYQFKQINVNSRLGSFYMISLVLTVLTSFTVSSTGGLNPGHIFGLIVLIVALAGFAIGKKELYGNAGRYISTFLLSFSFFMSLIPGVNETLTRVPLASPIAAQPGAPIILKVIGVLFAGLIVGFIAQVFYLKRNRSQAM